MPVELTWEGKYDADGRKCAPLRLTLPFQTVETVNESVQERQRGLDALFGGGQATEWRNRLIWGDKRYVLPSLLPEFAGKVNLIYIDPPFNTGANFSFEVEVEGEEFTKEPSMIEQKAYRDTWGRGLESYLQWFYEMALMLHDLLDEKGGIYVHCDWRLQSVLRVILGEIFVEEILEIRLFGREPARVIKPYHINISQGFMILLSSLQNHLLHQSTFSMTLMMKNT